MALSYLEPGIVEKSEWKNPPISIQQPPIFITRQPLYLQNPTAFSANQWRQIAKEPITRLCIRHILRELTSLEWEVSSLNPEKDAEQVRFLTTVLENADDGDGWDTWLSRVLLDALTLPMAGNSEVVPDKTTGILGGLYHVDGATLYPTYERDIPFVQINPYNTVERIYFVKGDIMRLILQPRSELQRKPFQEAPVESAFVGIEALSRMYVYYLKQLTDTPIAGILDVMDMTQDEAQTWAENFREMLNGVDPLKMPLLYDHVKPARLIPFGRSPTDLALGENFKRFAELVVSGFGLSIGDLRLFEHERTLAGVEASQRVTARSGIGYYAQAVEDMMNRSILMTSLTGFKFKFKLGMTGEEQAEAQLAQTRATILTTLAGPTQPLLKPEDAQAQLVAWGVVDVPLSGTPQAPGLEGLGDVMGGGDQFGGGGGEVGTSPDESGGPQVGEESGGGYDIFNKALVSSVFGSRGPQVNTEVADRFLQLLSEAYNQITSENVLDTEWYKIPDVSTEIAGILTDVYDQAALDQMVDIQQRGYVMGVSNRLESPVIQFRLSDPDKIREIEVRSNKILDYIDEGSVQYLKNYPTPEDAKLDLFSSKPETLGYNRLTIIASAEMAWARGLAQFDLLKRSGFTEKIWINNTPDVDEISTNNASLRAVPIDYEYAGRFERVQAPPADPAVTECRIVATDQEIKDFYESNSVFWLGAPDTRNIDKEIAPAGAVDSAGIGYQSMLPF